LLELRSRKLGQRDHSNRFEFKVKVLKLCDIKLGLKNLGETGHGSRFEKFKTKVLKLCDVKLEFKRFGQRNHGSRFENFKVMLSKFKVKRQLLKRKKGRKKI
jgi:hypothetical protein